MIYKYAIDFGTTNSSLAVRVRDGISKKESDILFPRGGRPTIPSLVCVDDRIDENIIENIPVGEEAEKKFIASNSKGKTIIRKIKMQIDDEKETIKLRTMGRSFRTVPLVAAILKKLKDCADEELTKLEIEPHGAVMGVPVSFSDGSKQMLRQALVLAGFYHNEREAKTLTEFVSEPVAVAVHYGVKLESKKTVMVFDFGGGTLDVAILQVNPQGKNADKKLPHDVLAKERETLGGEDLNKLVYKNIFVPHYKKELEKYRSNLEISPRIAMDDVDTVWNLFSKTNLGQGIQEQIEEIKIRLSTEPLWDFQYTGPDGTFFPKTLITQSEFEEAISETFDKIQNLVERCLKQADLRYYDIDDVLLAGGSSLIPCIQNIYK